MRNPKQEGTNLFSCRPQVGLCPNNCNQCYYNRPGACDIENEDIPDPAEVGDGIVRMNHTHDSNIEKELVIETARQYKNYFFNTSIPNYDFPGPVVLTANPAEERRPYQAATAPDTAPNNLMFVRLRVSASNIVPVMEQITDWVLVDVPVVLTFMNYYDDDEVTYVIRNRHPYLGNIRLYEEKTHVANSYWCPTTEMKRAVGSILNVGINRLVTMCGSINSNLCKDCRNCEHWYWITKRRMELINEISLI